MVDAFGPEVDIVVVDGGSDDGTVDVLAGRTRVVRSPPGRGRQMNAGAERARGDIVLFLHADTLLVKGAHAAISNALADQDVVGGCFRLRLRGPSAQRPIARILVRCIDLRTLLFGSATGDQAIFARRWAFEKAGGFDDVGLFEDVLFYRRLRRLGKLVLLDPAVRTSDRRWRRNGYVRTIATHLTLRLLFWFGAAPATLDRLYRRVR